jgi:hypothetical protein
VKLVLKIVKFKMKETWGIQSPSNVFIYPVINALLHTELSISNCVK